MKYEPNKITELLSLHQKIKEVTLLLLGATGVGKSTWINAFYHYLLFPSFEDALEEKEPIYLIPTKFSYNFRERGSRESQSFEISIGQEKNENLEYGVSGTIFPKCYRFLAGYHEITIIDTPGLSNTNSVFSEQDSKNLDNIMRCLTNFQEIHAIILFLKPDESRSESPCPNIIKELLSRLHKSAANKIIFCFTHAIGSNYTGGDTLSVLKKSIKDYSSIKTDKNMFFFDSESFRYLAAIRQNSALQSTKEEQRASENLDEGVRECKNLLSFIDQLAPHNIKETLTIDDARKKIHLLNKPIGARIRNIYSNKEHLQSEIGNAEKEEADLQRKLLIVRSRLEPVKLNYPRTVCTEAKCKTPKIDAAGVIHEKYKVCDPHCFCGIIVESEIVGDNGLLVCGAIRLPGGECKVCNCSYKKHMHILYKEKITYEQIIDEEIKKKIENCKTLKERKKVLLDRLNEEIEEYEMELKIITKICCRFAAFMNQSALVPYNDTFISNIDLHIRDEQNPSIKKGLQQTKDEYEKFTGMLENANAENQVQIVEIPTLLNQLYSLKHSGPDLKSCVDLAEEALAAENSFKIKFVNPVAVAFKMAKQLKRLKLTKINNYMSNFFSSESKKFH